MEKHLIDVLIETEDEDGNNSQLARIIKKTQSGFKIQFLSETNILYEDRMRVFRFDKHTEEIEEESVSGYYDTPDIEEAGYIKIEGVGYVKSEDYDDDYNPSESDYSESDSESLDESEYDEDEDEDE